MRERLLELLGLLRGVEEEAVLPTDRVRVATQQGLLGCPACGKRLPLELGYNLVVALLGGLLTATAWMLGRRLGEPGSWRSACRPMPVSCSPSLRP